MDKKRTAMEFSLLLNLLRFCIYNIYKQHPHRNKTYTLATMRKLTMVTRAYVFFLYVLSCYYKMCSYFYPL